MPLTFAAEVGQNQSLERFLSCLVRVLSLGCFLQVGPDAMKAMEEMDLRPSDALLATVLGRSREV